MVNDIYKLIMLSKITVIAKPEILTTALIFWNNETNIFDFRMGLKASESITHLKYKSSTFKCNGTSFSDFILFVKKMFSLPFPTVDWLNKHVFPNKSKGVKLQWIPLVNALHSFDDVAIGPFNLAHLYHLLHEMTKREPFETNLNGQFGILQRRSSSPHPGRGFHYQPFHPYLPLLLSNLSDSGRFGVGCLLDVGPKEEVPQEDKEVLAKILEVEGTSQPKPFSSSARSVHLSLLRAKPLKVYFSLNLGQVCICTSSRANLSPYLFYSFFGHGVHETTHQPSLTFREPKVPEIPVISEGWMQRDFITSFNLKALQKAENVQYDFFISFFKNLKALRDQHLWATWQSNRINCHIEKHC
ncbi:S2-RNase [Pyrus ussuriensis x Pyrus communis]|uniref:S2-RNase n=1 Tax=Pyrus ussuriensis x Pyrus communis TaxID=2448454 RepID=A0A5N5I9Q3_9ROSA|nr:S2-RNase [Pyrus ussuriensis x Pyrus communis]